MLRFKRDESNKIFYKTSMKENALFKVLYLFEKEGRPRNFSKITMFPLYKTSRPVDKTREKHSDMMSLLSCILPFTMNTLYLAVKKK